MVAYNIILGIALFVSLVFTLLIFVTGKGDAMSGGGSIRTTFRGKATIDEQIAKVTMALGGAFVALMLILDVLGSKVHK